ncbi:MAG: aldose 1-epimerase family protein [Flavobacterium sp.]
MRTTIANSNLTAIINHQGAELISLQKNNSKREYIWEGKPEFWGKHSPVLFPIVGTLKNSSYIHNGKNYQLPRHGFARDMVFTLMQKTDNEAIFSSQSDEQTKKLYPFEFELLLFYKLNDSDLTITYQVVNKGHETMFYSIGGHPAFALPDEFENYKLQFEPNENLVSYQLENDLLSDKTIKIPLAENRLPLSYSLFEKDALIFKELKSKQIRLLEKGNAILNFKFNDFPNFGIWTKIGAPFICLEPWLGYSDLSGATGNLSEKEGIQPLESNTSNQHSFSVEIL